MAVALTDEMGKDSTTGTLSLGVEANGAPWFSHSPTSLANTPVLERVLATLGSSTIDLYELSTIPSIVDIFEGKHDANLPTSIDPVGAITQKWAANFAARVDVLEFEKAFERLGSWAGPYSTRKGMKAEFDYWSQQGPRAAAWLLAKLEDEHGIEALNAVANVLANMGPVSLTIVIQSLESNPSRDQASVLLDALTRLGPQTEGPADRIALSVMRFIASGDPDLRVAAAEASSVLPAYQANWILKFALAAETDPAVRKAIEDQIYDREMK